MPALGTLEQTNANVKAEAAAIVENMKDEQVKSAFAKLFGGEIRQIVALIAYLNSLK